MAQDLTPAGVSEAVSALTLSRAVVDEAMRLFPPAYVIVRQAINADRLDDLPVEPGTVILISPWVLHRHRQPWRAPDVFAPERFLDKQAAVSRFAYLPVWRRAASLCRSVIGRHRGDHRAVDPPARLSHRTDRHDTGVAVGGNHRAAKPRAAVSDHPPHRRSGRLTQRFPDAPAPKLGSAPLRVLSTYPTKRSGTDGTR
jgi:cytochrome P450